MSKVIQFFATRGDLTDLLIAVESVHNIYYVKAGMSEEPDPVVFDSVSTIPSLCEPRIPGAGGGWVFLMADRKIQFVVERVPQRRGGIRFAIDQRLNPDTASLFPGGKWDAQTYLSGSIGTCTDSPVSAALYAMVSASIRKRWTRVKSFRMGPEALGLLDKGVRFTQNVSAPPEYDLCR